jgi:hypothetical protein
MDYDEREICRYLKGWPDQFISATEIGSRACGKKRFHSDPNWATPALLRLVDKQIVETDFSGHFRLATRSEKKAPTRWLSPQVRKVLEASGKNFDGVFSVDEIEA